MQTDINLLTKEEKTEQFKRKAVKFSSIFTVFLLVAVTGVSGYYFMKAAGLKKEIKAEDTEISQLRSRIKSMADIEIVARNLYKKYTAIEEIFSERIYYSRFLTHFWNKVPEGVSISSFTFRGDQISISGTGSNYLQVSQFLRNLIDEAPEFKVFTSATLNSVSLDPSNSSVSYSIVVGFNPEVLKE